MVEILTLDGSTTAQAGAGHATQVLERGGLVLLPDRTFNLDEGESAFLDPAILARSKNVSLDPSAGRVSGTTAQGADLERLSAMLGRFSVAVAALLAELTPTYAAALQRRRISFRPGPVGERVLSARKDDRRLHIDAFPSNPVQGRRILRVFANIDPLARPRVWNVGEDGFERLARRYRSRLRPFALGGWLMQRLRVTNGRRTPYDRAMLQLHDLAKLDEGFQAEAPKRRLEFPAGSMWVVYTDSVLHAALAGQHALEQTFLLPVDAMHDPSRAPLTVLERVLGAPLQ